MSFWLLAYLGMGTLAGFFAGLLGIGGGGLLVPLLVMAFSAQAQFAPGEIMHMALGTSMASIVFTSVSSVRAHHAHGAVLWPVVGRIAPGIFTGVLLGSSFASRVDTRSLAIFFTVFMGYMALQMFLNIKPKAHRDLPGWGGTSVAGLVIGGISSLVAIGGGILSVPFLTWCNVRIQNAIATSAAIGMPLAFGGALGYILNGLGHPNLPENSLGFVYLPALGGLVSASVLMAPVGARLAHRLPVATLKRVFAVVTLLLAGKMLYGVLNP